MLRCAVERICEGFKGGKEIPEESSSGSCQKGTSSTENQRNHALW